MVEESDVSGADIIQLGGNINLINFDIEPVYMAVVKKIVGNYARKINEVSNYKELRLRLKKHEHGKSILYEIDAEAVIIEGKTATHGKNIILNASVSNYNLNSALSEALEKIFAEALHKSRTTKEIGLEIKKLQEKEQKE